MKDQIKAISAVFAMFTEEEKKLTMREADRLYSETFRSQEIFTVHDYPEMREDLVEYLTSAVYPARVQNCSDMDCSWLSDDDNDFWCDNYDPEPIFVGYSKDDAELILENAKFVWLCNYKGEGEGFTLIERASGLRVFVDKHNYF